MSKPIRVLIVDDSAFARKVVREVLSAEGIDVVGVARDGLEALELIATLRPDVVTLDLMMPNLDGLGVLRALPKENAPRIVVVSISSHESERGVEALQAGAVALVQKPSALATDQLYEMGGKLVHAIKEAFVARHVVPRPSNGNLAQVPDRTPRCELVVIGTSTGGPQALTHLLAVLPKDFPVPLAIALHIPAGYTEELAKRLDGACAIDVVEAADGMELRPGLALLARGGTHMMIAPDRRSLFVQLDDHARGEAHAPSVDLLFESAAKRTGGATLGVVMTGMGNDGLRGARAIHDAGGKILTEAEASCVVYGMPRVVHEAGISTERATLEDMALAISKHL